MIKDFYKDKVMLITGTTGFLGKVLLEKLFRSAYEFKRIYVLVRPKRGTSIMDRVKREIFQSQCFDIARKMPQFDQIVQNKIIPIEGDITKDGLAMKPEDRERLVNDLDVIINCAASVDFNERLCDALNINYFGCLRMYQLASECKKLQIFTHVSTCYVNCEKKGFIQEKIYDINEDSEEVVNKILQMTPTEQDANLDKILGLWPNTYTFTKSMAERTLRKLKRPDMPVVLLRPSIIGASYKEPVPGWTDTFSAAGGLSLAGGTGIVNYVRGDGDNIADLVPVDYVANAILVSTAFQANKPGLTIVHSATSHTNPITWFKYMTWAFDYLKTQPFEQQLFHPHMKFIPNKYLFQTMFFLRNDLPVRIYNKLAKIPGIGGAQMQKNGEKLAKVNLRAFNLGLMFEHFTNNQWIFETSQIYQYIQKMTKEEQDEFQIDPKTINWPLATKIYLYGMQKFILKQEVICPTHETSPIISKNQYTYFEDIKFAFFNGQTISHYDPEKLRRDVLTSDYIQNYIQQAINAPNNSQQSPGKQVAVKSYDQYIDQASKYLEEMQAVIRPATVRPFLWIMSKVWQRIYDQIIVNVKGLETIRTLMEKNESSIVLLPTHKSYLDFLLIAYVHYHYKLDLPFTCGDQQFFNVAFVRYLLKSGGGFFRNEKLLQDELFQAVMQAYLESLMNQNCILQLFLERKRSRSGKIQRPNEPLFEDIIKNYFRRSKIQKNHKDIKFVPMTINYDIVYEGESFPLELLGESKVEESLIRVIKQFSYLNKNIGKVVIKYCEPISLEEYTASYLKENNLPIENFTKDEKAIKVFSQSFGNVLCQTQTDNIVVMITSLTASILLMHRKGISYDLLLQKIDWLFKETQARNAELSFNASPSSTMISTSLRYLERFLDRKRNVFEPSVSAKKDYKNVMMLAYYRNQLIHLFINDAEVACSILGFGSLLDLSKDLIKVDELYQRFTFLQYLLSQEFVVKKQNRTKENLMRYLEFMESRGMFTYDKQQGTLKMDLKDSKQAYSHSFLCHLLLPYIESYWLTLIYFISLENKQSLHDESTVYNKIQWLAETLHDQAFVKFYESCMLESIKNAVTKFTQMGVLIKKEVTKRRQVTYVYQLSEQFLEGQKVVELYEAIIFYMPYPPQLNLQKIQSEIRKIMMSDIQLMPKL